MMLPKAVEFSLIRINKKRNYFMEKKNRPEWVPEDASDEFFTTEVKKGINPEDFKMQGTGAMRDYLKNIARRRAKALSLEDYKKGVLECDKTVLARAITLIESNSPAHMGKAQELVGQILPYTGKSFRIGITGVPGAGKSTFIEALGTMLCDMGHRVAVLAVDPSSSVSGGSILGDKTRMENLSRNKNAFIRPSPSGGVLGGVARKSRETMLLCEAAGYDIILIETVGVGQSEVTVRSMSDFFLLIQLAAQGDELQGIKKGVIELADAILVNKCDGNMVERSRMRRAELSGVLHYLKSPTPDWSPFCDVCSAETGLGIKEAWEKLWAFKEKQTALGHFQKRRNAQKKEWLYSVLNDEVLRDFYSDKKVSAMMEGVLADVESSKLPVTSAVKMLLAARGISAVEE